MAKDPLRVGIVGPGYIAQAQHIPNWLRLSNAKITAIVDTREKLAATVADHLDVPAYSDLSQALADIDVAHICTPHTTHLELIEMAARAGKDILVEKPLAPTAADASAAVDAAESAGVRLMIGYPRLFDSDLAELCARLDAGVIGRVGAVQSHWSIGRPPAYPSIATWPRTSRPNTVQGSAEDLLNRMLDESIHHLGLLRSWFGPLEVAAPPRNSSSVWHVELRAGDVLIWHTNATPAGHLEEISVFGSLGSASVRPWSSHFPWTYGSSRYDVLATDMISYPRLPRRNQYEVMLEHFVASLRKGTAFDINPRDAVGDIATAESIVTSFRSTTN